MGWIALAWLLHIIGLAWRSGQHEGSLELEMQLFPSMHLPSPLIFSPLCRRKIYGPNLIEVPVKSYARLLVEEVCIYGLCFKRASCPRADPSPAPCPLLQVLYGPFLSDREERILGGAAWAEIREGRAGTAVDGTGWAS